MAHSTISLLVISWSFLHDTCTHSSETGDVFVLLCVYHTVIQNEVMWSFLWNYITKRQSCSWLCTLCRTCNIWTPHLYITLSFAAIFLGFRNTFLTSFLLKYVLYHICMSAYLKQKCPWILWYLVCLWQTHVLSILVILPECIADTCFNILFNYDTSICNALLIYWYDTYHWYKGGMIGWERCVL